jgi:hypothetical protein
MSLEPTKGDVMAPSQTGIDQQMRAVRTGPAEHSGADIASELAAWVVGGGIITMMLFPFALPLIALVAITALPFVLVPLAAGLVVAPIALPVLLVRSLGRRAIRALHSKSTAQQAATPAYRNA